MSAAAKDLSSDAVRSQADDAPRGDELVRDFFADSDDEGLSVSTDIGLHPPAAQTSTKKHASPRPVDDDDDDIEVLLDVVVKDKKQKVSAAGKDDDIEIVEPTRSDTKQPKGSLLPSSSKTSTVCRPSTSKAAQERVDEDDDNEEPADEVDDTCDFGFDEAFLDDPKALPPVGTKASGDCGAGLTGHGQLLARKMAALQKSILDADFKELHHRNFLECQNSSR